MPHFYRECEFLKVTILHDYKQKYHGSTVQNTNFHNHEFTTITEYFSTLKVVKMLSSINIKHNCTSRVGEGSVRTNRTDRNTLRRKISGLTQSFHSSNTLIPFRTRNTQLSSWSGSVCSSSTLLTRRAFLRSEVPNITLYGGGGVTLVARETRGAGGGAGGGRESSGSAGETDSAVRRGVGTGGTLCFYTSTTRTPSFTFCTVTSVIWRGLLVIVEFRTLVFD